MRKYLALRKHVLKELSENLSPKLTYHGFHHTQDVMEVCSKYIRKYDIKGEDARLLMIGAVTHDIGFLQTYQNHEEVGVEIISGLMKKYGFDEGQIERVSGLILATKVPQTPTNFIEDVLCDADLDYLGRDDFEPISESLFIELKNFNILTDRNEWNKVQVNFLENHHYHTDYAKEQRAPEKQKRLEELREKVAEPGGH